eukprot:UN5010
MRREESKTDLADSVVMLQPHGVAQLLEEDAALKQSSATAHCTRLNDEGALNCEGQGMHLPPADPGGAAHGLRSMLRALAIVSSSFLAFTTFKREFSKYLAIMSWPPPGLYSPKAEMKAAELPSATWLCQDSSELWNSSIVSTSTSSVALINVLSRLKRGSCMLRIPK